MRLLQKTYRELNFKEIAIAVSVPFVFWSIVLLLILVLDNCKM